MSVRKVIWVRTVEGWPVLITATTRVDASKGNVPVRVDMKGKAVHLEAASTTATTMASVKMDGVSVRRDTLERIVQLCPHHGSSEWERLLRDLWIFPGIMKC